MFTMQQTAFYAARVHGQINLEFTIITLYNRYIKVCTNIQPERLHLIGEGIFLFAFSSLNCVTVTKVHLKCQKVFICICSKYTKTEHTITY